MVRPAIRPWLQLSAWFAKPDPSGNAVVAAGDGVTGNARLTSTTGMVLLVLLAVEGATVLDVRGMITLHVFLGTLLLGPVALKVATTVFRFLRYYAGSAEYVRRGPPPRGLRMLGPLVILLSVTLLGTGVGLLAVRLGRGGLLLAAHKLNFIGWFAVMTVHVLGHLWEASVTSWQELRQLSRRRWLRLAAVVAALAIGVGVAAAVLPAASPWIHRPDGRSGHHSHD